MKKIAIFVEGLTEQQFIIKLLTEIAGKRKIKFELLEQKNGQLLPQEIVEKAEEKITLQDMQPKELVSADSDDFYILIANCCTDNQVKSQIIRKHESLSENGYSLIVGLRDFHPLKIEELEILESMLAEDLPTKGTKIVLIIAITEVEAWFLDEINHFEKIDQKMTIDAIKEKGFDLIKINGYQWIDPNPAKVLHEIYSHWGYAYKKNKKHINRTVNALDAEQLYLNVREKAASLSELITHLEEGLFPS